MACFTSEKLTLRLFLGDPEPRNELFGEVLDEDKVDTVSSVSLVVDLSSVSIEFDKIAKRFFCGDGVGFIISLLVALTFLADMYL